MTENDEEDIRFIRLADVLALVPVSESTLYRMISRKEFPKSVRIGGNVNMWVEAKVKAWMRKQIEEQEDELI